MIDIHDIELDTTGILIRGEPRKGKTLLSVDFAVDHRSHNRIYANLDIFAKRSGKRIGHKLNDIRDLQKIRLSAIPGVVILDEMSSNMNSRKGSSTENDEFSRFARLVGKKNCSIIWITHRYKEIDINARDKCSHIFHVTKQSRAGAKPIFHVYRQKQDGNDHLTNVAHYESNLLGIRDLYGINYNQIDTSDLTKNLREYRRDKMYSKVYDSDVDDD